METASFGLAARSLMYGPTSVCYSDDEKPFVSHRMGSGVSIFFDTVFAARYDAKHAFPVGVGYGSLFEFYLGEDAAVDPKYAELTAAGYRGQMAPERTFGPYAAMVDDPDGNVVLLTSDARTQTRAERG